MLQIPRSIIPFERKYNIPYHLTIALTQIGTTEIPGTKSNSKIDEYLKMVGIKGDDEIPWCSAFVNWCLLEAKCQPTRKPNARSFLEFGQELKRPELGCVVVLSRGTQSWQGHVGFYLDHHRGLISILGGNQINRVGVNKYSDKKLLGYREVLYND